MVLVETTLEPENLQVVLDENITRKTGFVSSISVQKPATGNNLNGTQSNIEVEKFSPPSSDLRYIPPTEPQASGVGDG